MPENVLNYDIVSCFSISKIFLNKAVRDHTCLQKLFGTFIVYNLFKQIICIRDCSC